MPPSATQDACLLSSIRAGEALLALMGSLSVSDDNSIEACFSIDFGFGVTLRPLDLVSGELSLFTRGFRDAVFFAGGAAVVVGLDAARVVRAGAGGTALAFVREEARVALGLLAMQRVMKTESSRVRSGMRRDS